MEMSAADLHHNTKQYEALHEKDASYGTSSSYLLPYIIPLARDLSPQHILDYGCGKSTLVHDLARQLSAVGWRYDPAIPKVSAKPDGPFDLVLNTDVLEHIPETALDSVLQDIRRLSPNVIFHIPTRHALQILPNGANAHCTVKSSPWWLEKLAQHFDYVKVFRSLSNDEQFYVTWQISEASRSDLKRVYRQKRRENSMRKRKDYLKYYKKRLTCVFADKEDLRFGLLGKRVAVVGNAASLSESEYGTEIDQYDIVIRLNSCVIPHTRSHGLKTNWIATSVALSAGHLTRGHPDYVLWMNPRNETQMPLWLMDKPDQLFLLKARDVQQLHKQIGTKPTTGLRLLNLLRQLGGFTELMIYGFDFFQTHSNTNHITQEKARQDHDYSKEQHWVENWTQADKRVRLRQSL